MDAHCFRTSEQSEELRKKLSLNMNIGVKHFG